MSSYNRGGDGDKRYSKQERSTERGWTEGKPIPPELKSTPPIQNPSSKKFPSSATELWRPPREKKKKRSVPKKRRLGTEIRYFLGKAIALLIFLPPAIAAGYLMIALWVGVAILLAVMTFRKY